MDERDAKMLKDESTRFSGMNCELRLRSDLTDYYRNLGFSDVRINPGYRVTVPDSRSLVIDVAIYFGPQVQPACLFDVKGYPLKRVRPQALYEVLTRFHFAYEQEDLRKSSFYFVVPDAQQLNLEFYDLTQCVRAGVTDLTLAQLEELKCDINSVPTPDIAKQRDIEVANDRYESSTRKFNKARYLIIAACIALLLLDAGGCYQLTTERLILIGLTIVIVMLRFVNNIKVGDIGISMRWDELPDSSSSNNDDE